MTATEDILIHPGDRANPPRIVKPADAIPALKKIDEEQRRAAAEVERLAGLREEAAAAQQTYNDMLARRAWLVGHIQTCVDTLSGHRQRSENLVLEAATQFPGGVRDHAVEWLEHEFVLKFAPGWIDTYQTELTKLESEIRAFEKKHLSAKQ